MRALNASLLLLGFMILLSSALLAGDAVDEVAFDEEEVPPPALISFSKAKTSSSPRT